MTEQHEADIRHKSGEPLTCPALTKSGGFMIAGDRCYWRPNFYGATATTRGPQFYGPWMVYGRPWMGLAPLVSDFKDDAQILSGLGPLFVEKILDDKLCQFAGEVSWHSSAPHRPLRQRNVRTGYRRIEQARPRPAGLGG
jgi:hypothetical protein